MTENKFGLALQAAGAGLTGRGPEFQQMLAGRRQAESESRNKQLLARQRAFAEDNRGLTMFLERGDYKSARELIVNRQDDLKNFPDSDTADTDGALDALDSGQYDELLRRSRAIDQQSVIAGILPARDKPKQQIVDGQLVTIGPDGAAASDIEGLRKDPGEAQDRSLRSRQIAVSEAAEARQSGKLSAGLEKALLGAQDRVVEAQRNANEYEVLASDFERLNLEGGLASTFSETLKNVLGSQDQVSEFRRKFNQVRISQGIKNLPPGPASDVDVKMAMKGVPKENASAGQVASFLRGSARIARFDAGYNQFKADYITQNRSGAGLNKSWRGSIQSPGLKRKVTIAEIYETAQNRGITPEDVAAQLGIEGGLF